MLRQKTASRRTYFSLLAVFGWLCLGFVAYATEPVETSTSSLMDLPIEDLMNIEIASTASLTKTKARLVPGAVTTITKDDIQTSAARSLLELLDIYVPNLQWKHNDWEADNLGLRGITNDRDDKYLMLVNGRVMNDHTHFGAITERDLVLLRDIHHIEIIRGSGSALYGPGAIAMVINITTDNAETFQGTEVSARAGMMEEFAATEFRHGQRFKDGDGGLYLYGGVGRYPGAAADHAPQKYTVDFPDRSYYEWDPTDPGPDLPCDGLQAGDAAPGSVINRDGAAARGLPPVKLHAEVTRGPWDIWARYTRGGQQMTHDIGALIHYPKGWGNWVASPMPDGFTAYQQATGYIGYNRELTDNVTFTGAFSYDMLDFERYSTWFLNDAYREDEYYGKAMVQWQINDYHKVAVGTEVLHGEYGIRSLDWPHDYARSGQFPTNMPRWSTDMYSALGEWQWTITDRWTTFIGGRIDEHSQTDTMISPRAAVAYTPTDKDTLKLMWSRSVRAQLAEEMEKQELNGMGNSAPETLSTVEFRYERQHNKALDLAATVFWHYDFDLVSWSGSDSNVIGTQKDYGVELEASYHTNGTRLAVSHAYTKLDDFELRAGESTFLTAEPYGYGNDLALWSNHVTKLTTWHKLDDHWTANGSMRVYWGFPGMKDHDRYLLANNANEPVDPNVDAQYQANCLLNLGLQYQPSDVLTVGINGYYLLGIFNEDLNKRIGVRHGYRDHAPALGIWAIYKFR